MVRALFIIAAFGLVVLNEALRLAPSRPYCRYASHCSTKFCKPKTDRRGCPFRGCPCDTDITLPTKYYPPVLRPYPCPVCITTPCDCICPRISCDKDCGPNGWVKDSVGCNTCQCKSDLYSPPVLKPKTCPVCITYPCNPPCECDKLYCEKDCPNGWVQDARGCNTCECKQKAEVYVPPVLLYDCIYCFTTPCPGCKTCPRYECSKDCGENGWVKDHRGCNTCQCKSEIVCPYERDCQVVKCGWGIRRDENGCAYRGCPCNPRPVCLFESDCAAKTCIKGPQTDNNGCALQGCPCKGATGGGLVLPILPKY